MAPVSSSAHEDGCILSSMHNDVACKHLFFSFLDWLLSVFGTIFDWPDVDLLMGGESSTQLRTKHVHS